MISNILKKSFSCISSEIFSDWPVPLKNLYIYTSMGVYRMPHCAQYGNIILKVPFSSNSKKMNMLFASLLIFAFCLSIGK